MIVPMILLATGCAAIGFAPGLVAPLLDHAIQAKQAGVTIKINNVTDAATYFAKYYKQAPFKFDYFNT